ncbi:MAG: YSC84-related protein, partial [Bryobacteraceae bacterium]
MIRPILLASLAAGLTSSLAFGAEETTNSRMHNATLALEAMMHAPDNGIPDTLIDRAQCVIIIPNLIKGAFLFGGKYGRGYAACREGNGWSAPAAVRIEGGSFGLQWGGSATDLIMLIMNRHGMNGLLQTKFTIGGNAEAAAGPVGRQTGLATDVSFRAEMLSWSRSRGVFAGLSVNGATLRPDSSENEKLYGRPISTREILTGHVKTPAVARPFMATIETFGRPGPVEARNRRRPLANRNTNATTAEKRSNDINQPGDRIVLSDKQVQFGTGSSQLPPGADSALTDVANKLKANPSWHVQVEGFTDNTGSKQ